MPHLLRIFVVDDDEMVRRGICALLRAEPDFEVICQAADGIQAVQEAEKLQPDERRILGTSIPRSFRGVPAMPKAKQFSVSHENRPGMLAEIAKALGDQKVNILSCLTTTSGRKEPHTSWSTTSTGRGRRSRAPS